MVYSKDKQCSNRKYLECHLQGFAIQHQNCIFIIKTKEILKLFLIYIQGYLVFSEIILMFTLAEKDKLFRFYPLKKLILKINLVRKYLRLSFKIRSKP